MASRLPRTPQCFLAFLAVVCVFRVNAGGEASHVYYEYQGELGSGRVIRMTLEMSGRRANGSYFYKKSLQDITLEGEFITDRDIVLHEVDGQGIAGATFSLRFAETDPRGHFNTESLADEVLAGSWSSADNTATHPVYLYLIGEARVQEGDGRYSVAGATDDAAVEKNAQAFYFAVLKNQRTVAAKYAAYPVSFYRNGKPDQARNAREFLRDYNAIFTGNFLSRIAAGIPHNMFANSDGIMLGDGEVWFDRTGRARHFNN